jgi:hypothetical protein
MSKSRCPFRAHDIAYPCRSDCVLWIAGDCSIHVIAESLKQIAKGKTNETSKDTSSEA